MYVFFQLTFTLTCVSIFLFFFCFFIGGGVIFHPRYHELSLSPYPSFILSHSLLIALYLSHSLSSSGSLFLAVLFVSYVIFQKYFFFHLKCPYLNQYINNSSVCCFLFYLFLVPPLRSLCLSVSVSLFLCLSLSFSLCLSNSLYISILLFFASILLFSK